MAKQEKKVPEQKGPINPNPMTSKQMPHSEKVRERAQEIKDRVRGQTLDYHSPQKR